jgi:hypothetical protein
MTDITSSVQIILQEAGYATWLVAVDQLTVVCFEDDAVMGFVSIFEEPGLLLQNWRSVESTLLTRHAPRFREAEEKAWNVYSIFLCSKPASEDETREIRRIDEDLERTRKVAACGLAVHADIVTALLPVLPIQYRPRLEGEDLTERLKKRIAAIAPAAVDVALDETVAPADVVRLLGAPT